MRIFRAKGFTLIELMIVVAIIGVLASIAIPLFSNLVAKSKESTTKANLGTLRSALAIYYGENDAWYPTDSNNLDSLTAGARYLTAIPPTVLPKTTNSPGHAMSVAIQNGAVDDAAGYIYFNGGVLDSTWGKIIINCDHEDLRTYAWSSY